MFVSSDGSRHMISCSNISYKTSIVYLLFCFKSSNYTNSFLNITYVCRCQLIIVFFRLFSDNTKKNNELPLEYLYITFFSYVCHYLNMGVYAITTKEERERSRKTLEGHVLHACRRKISL
jgi:hypothetical protein